MDGARNAGELYGRALVVFAAQHYASQLVLPTSQRRSSVLPGSHKDIARMAFERVTKHVLPASHSQLQRAVTAEARAYPRRVAALDASARTGNEACGPVINDSHSADDHLEHGNRDCGGHDPDVGDLGD